MVVIKISKLAGYIEYGINIILRNFKDIQRQYITYVKILHTKFDNVERK